MKKSEFLLELVHIYPSADIDAIKIRIGDKHYNIKFIDEAHDILWIVGDEVEI